MCLAQGHNAVRPVRLEPTGPAVSSNCPYRSISSTHSDLVTLTYISRSGDFAEMYFSVTVNSCEFKTCSVIVSSIHFELFPWPGDLEV